MAKILVVQESDWLLRGPHQQHHLMERLSLRGHKIHVIDYPIMWRNEKGGLFKSGFKLKNVSKYYDNSTIDLIRPPIIRFPLLDLISILLFYPFVINKEIREYKPDIVIGFGILNTLIALLLCTIHQIPFVYYLIDSLHTLIENQAYRAIAFQVEKINLKIAKNIITINKVLRLYCIKMGASPTTVTVLSAGIDIEKYTVKYSISEIRQEVGIKKDDIVIFFMGWLYRFSGLIEVADKLDAKKAQNNIKLLIVGDGDIYDELVNKANKNKNIIMTGKVDYSEIPRLLSIADVCILPAYNNKIMENIVPIKIYEYLASAKPVIATKLNGLYTEFGDNAGIIYVDGPQEVLESAINLHKNDDKYKQKSVEAISKVKQYSWNKVTDGFENYLTTTIA